MNRGKKKNRKTVKLTVIREERKRKNKLRKKRINNDKENYFIE